MIRMYLGERAIALHGMYESSEVTNLLIKFMCSIRGLIRRELKDDSNIGILFEYLVEWASALHSKSLLSIKNVIERLLFQQLCQLQTILFIYWRRKN